MASTDSIELVSDGSKYLSITDASQTGLDLTGDCTLMCWFRPDSTNRGHALLTKYDFNISQRSYFFDILDSNRVRLLLSDDGTNVRFAVSLEPIPSYTAFGSWYHIAAVFNSANDEAQFYINGSAHGSVVAMSGTGATTIHNGTAPFVVGTSANGSAPTRGLIDHIRVYDDQRSAGEIYTDYSTDPTASGNLQAGYTLDGVLTDVSGNGNTLTNTGSLSFAGFGQPTLETIPTYSGVAVSGTMLSHGDTGIHNFRAGDGQTAKLEQSDEIQLLYRMRGYDQNIAVDGIVFWDSDQIDENAVHYAGSAGPVVDIVVHKILGG